MSSTEQTYFHLLVIKLSQCWQVATLTIHLTFQEAGMWRGTSIQIIVKNGSYRVYSKIFSFVGVILARKRFYINNFYLYEHA